MHHAARQAEEEEKVPVGPRSKSLSKRQMNTRIDVVSRMKASPSSSLLLAHPSSQSTTIISNPSSIGISRKTLVLDLDETLVHSSLRGFRHDFMVEVMLEQQQICYYVYKRPHVDYFLQKVSDLM